MAAALDGATALASSAAAISNCRCFARNHVELDLWQSPGQRSRDASNIMVEQVVCWQHKLHRAGTAVQCGHAALQVFWCKPTCWTALQAQKHLPLLLVHALCALAAVQGPQL